MREDILTLRQIEVMRAILVAGIIAGAVKLFNVLAPGVSQLLKYTDNALKMKRFHRENGRFVPTREAHDIFEQTNGVCKKVEVFRQGTALRDAIGDVSVRQTKP